MKKVVGVVGVLVLIVIGFFGYQYWNSTYNGVEAYALVTEGKKEASKNEDGSLYKVNGKQYYTYEYELKWVTKDGQTRNLGYSSEESANPKALTPSSYVKAKVAQKRVLTTPQPISKQALPQTVKAKLK
ncbi:YxeA family protein [Lacticaseibacillus rhamnosus]|uniref:YxeA family protein n=1 Tax=Lacticaseibacillus rhamnosus TaxID=47715 RepID=UPI00214C6169|nr:YxeA family protein [Lacticaseibacillus rhamnosus]UUT37237.1 YxeA family protein [Lacticaseibacillus rhamnosus]